MWRLPYDDRLDPAGFGAHDQFWPLVGKHAAATCESCHVGGVFAGTARTCEGCHLADYQATTAPAHAAAGYPTTCETCHAATGGWTPATFDHGRFWPLAGAHRTATCAGCHVDGVFAGTPKDCESCHLGDYQASSRPPHVADGYPKDCETCHSATAWAPASFNHATYWPLLGAHASTTCVGCHAGGVFAGTAKTCDGCHLSDYQTTTDPPHAAAGLSTRCETCHTATGWAPATLDHTLFWPLLGAHKTATCESCHVGGVYEGTPKVCASCHLADYQATTQPAHAATGYPTTCETCHGSVAWTPVTFDHGLFWPLTGWHATVACESCHIGGVFEGTPRTCEGCHLADYVATVDPPHAAAGFSAACETCHGTLEWRPSTYAHDGWPLAGRHATATCDSCHGNGVYAGTPRACVGCHDPDYVASTQPSHVAGGYPKTCETCHGPAAWAPSTFNHAATWPLAGRHATATCESCHVGGVFAGTARTCVGCHLPDYQATTDPEHSAAGFSTSCETCHSAAAWSPSTFDHTAIWPLTGQHAAATCESCHGGGVYAGTPSACVDCHLADYQATVAPDHAASGFPTNCESCHTATGWTPATFDHSAFWPLTGRHATATCESCHEGGVYAGTPTACEGCHLTDYEATTQPAHAEAGFPVTCETCHTATGWTPATFDHATFWPLVGEHATATCESCHGGGVYAGTPTACEGCHLSDYQATTQPAHAAAGFPVTCETCHTATGWTPATFDHAAFWPLTGRHASATCESCHEGGVYAGTPTACVGCHRPDYDTSTNPSHVSLNLSTTCETCHTTTNWDTRTFPGHDTLFPITTGNHRIFACLDCHKVPADWGVFTCTGCHTGEHNLADVADDHREVGNYQATVNTYGLEGACLHCHPDGRN